MHSSRMHTAHGSSHPGGVSTPPRAHPPGAGTPPGPATPPEQAHTPTPRAGTPQSDPLQLPPWVWAWTRSPSTSPLGVGLETCKACWDTTPLPSRPAARHAGI